MTRLVLLFKTTSKRSDFERRLRQNIALLRNMSGVQRVQRANIPGGPGGKAPYNLMIEVFFENMDALDAALTAPAGVAAGKDLMSFAAQQVELLFVESEDETERPLGPDNLQAFLDSHEIPAEIVRLRLPTPNVETAAKALDVSPDQIVKSLIILVEERPFLLIACGTRKVDMHRLAERLNVPEAQVRMANANEVLSFSGFKVGAVPPLGLKTHMPTFIDPEVQAHETVYAGGGDTSALLKIASADLVKASNAEIASLLEAPPEDEAE